MEENHEAPEFFVKFVGHIYGGIFILLSAFCFWMIYRLIFNPSVPGLIFLSISLLVAYFFGVTAFKMISGKQQQIIAPYGYLLTCIVLAILGIFGLNDVSIMLATKEKLDLAGIHLIVITILSFPLSYYCFQLYKQKRKP
jgi:branched-subunit amino acid transport protein AzlD